MRRALVSLLVFAVAAALTGCGGGGVSSGATVSVYVTAPLCAGARRELGRSGGRAGDFRVRAVCLRGSGRAGETALAGIGAGARRAVEDSTTVGYLGESQRVAVGFSHTILESAGIASIYRSSGAAAMARLLQAVREAGSSSSLRQAVQSNLNGR